MRVPFFVVQDYIIISRTDGSSEIIIKIAALYWQFRQ